MKNELTDLSVGNCFTHETVYAMRLMECLYSLLYEQFFLTLTGQWDDHADWRCHAQDHSKKLQYMDAPAPSHE